MRVTILGRDFPPAIGGIGDHTDLLAQELARRGVEVSVVCSAPADERQGFTVRPVVRRWDGRGHDEIVRAVVATEPNAILWQYNPFAVGHRGVAPTAGRLARRLARCAPLVTYAHELWFPWGRDGVRGLIWASTQRLQTRAVLRASSSIVVTTETRERELARGGFGERVRRVPVGTNVPPRGRAARKRYGIDEDAFVLAHFGSAGPGRDLAPAYDAIRALRAKGIRAVLLLIGNTGPIQVRDEVVATGTLGRAELSDALSSADVYLHSDPVGPSAGRRGSLVAALAHTLPVIAYRGPDAAPQLIDGESVVLIERNAIALTRILESLATDPARRRAMSEAVGLVYRSHFAWDVIGEAMVRILQECAR